MKNKRQQEIIELIKNYVIVTQDELQDKLEGLGFNVTQSTVSRDIKDLRIIKNQDSNGIYRYMISTDKSVSSQSLAQYENVFLHACIDVLYSMNTVIIKCHSGMASSACVALDKLHSDIVIGSLAGDDTVFAITSGEKNSILLTERLKKLIER